MVIFKRIFRHVMRCPVTQKISYIHPHTSQLNSTYCAFNKSAVLYKKTVNSYLFVNKRCASSETYNSDSEQNEEEDIENTENTSSINIRSLLNANSSDPLINQLNECASVQEVFNIIRANHEKMNWTHISQSVLVLWDLQKIFYKHNVFFESDFNSNSVLSANAILKNYMDQVNAHEDFEKLLFLIENNYKEFSLDALTCTLLYLNRMGVKLKSKVVQLMIMRCEDEINRGDKDTFPLTALSRFIVTVFSQESLYPILVSVNAFPIVLHRLEKCTTAEDFKLLTICLTNMQQLVLHDCLENYKQICENLIKNGVISSNSHRTVIKALRFLNQPQWYEYNSQATNKLMHLLKGSVNQLTSRELILLFKVLQIQREPADMLEEIQNCATKHLSDTKDDHNNCLETTLDLLSCITSFSPPLQRPKFEKLAREYVNTNLTFSSFASLYKIFLHIKSSDTKLCSYFWDKYLQCILQDESSKKLQNLLSLCHKYMHFFRDIGHKYRYFSFEKAVVDLLVQQMDSTFFTLVPGTFARIASFIIAFSPDDDLVERTMQQLLQISHKLTPIDLLNISRGLQFVDEKLKSKTNPSLSKLIQELNKALDETLSRHLQENSQLQNVNLLLRGFVLRKRDSESELFEKMLKCYVLNPENLTSHMLKDVAFSLHTNECLMPEVVDEISEFVVRSGDNVLGNTVEKVLTLCYFLGYMPRNNDEFFAAASDLIIRDKERFSGLAFLQSCLALCFFHQLPNVLVKHVFSVEFLEKLDEELSNCYAKATYPIRVRDNLMQLNRAVCLDYPESNVPWFHQKFVDEFKKRQLKKSYFQGKVHSTLSHLLKDTSNTIQEEVYTPYGYHIDFEMKYNNQSSAAILLLNSKAYTNRTPNLKGYLQLKQRHLEILGYNVITVNSSEWKTLYSQESCTEFMRNKIALKSL